MKSTFTAALLLSLLATSAGRAAIIYESMGNSVWSFDTANGAVINHRSDSQSFTYEGLAIGPDNRLYNSVAFGANRVDVGPLDLSPPNNYVPEGSGGLFTPFGAAFGPDGNLYVASDNSGAVNRYFGPAAANPGSPDPSAGHFGAVFSNVTNPIGIAFAPDGTLYVTSQTGNGAILRIDNAGATTSVATGIGSNNVGDIAISGDGSTLYARAASVIAKYAINPDHSLTRDNSFAVHYTSPFPGTAPSLDISSGLTLGPDGFLYASTRSANNNPDVNFNEDWLVRINTTSGIVTPVVQANNNAFNGQNPSFVRFAPAPVPEPSTMALVGIGAIVMGAVLRRKTKA